MPIRNNTKKQNKAADIPEATRIPPAKHGIDPDQISTNAMQVIKQLTSQGYEAYLVGGGVRDLLLGARPKDFDISTDATPEQVVRLFRKARVIGRRFKIAHVYFGREVIEVTTFRGHHQDAPQSPHASRSNTGLLLRDNIYGSLAEDALRRDFTTNALYYDISDNTVLDYTEGYADVHQRVLRIIGDPEQRYREDPVRMLRAIRFAAKLNFTIHPDTAAPIIPLAMQLSQVAPARMFDEVLKLLLSGHGEATYRLMQQYQLFAPLFPQTDACMDETADRFILQALINTDKRLAKGLGITPAFFFAVVLWPPLLQTVKKYQEQGLPPAIALNKASHEVTVKQMAHISVPRRFTLPMREIWDLQGRLQRRQGKRAERLVNHPRFRAAYDFLLLREECGEDMQGLGQWWTDYQEADAEERSALSASLGKSRPRRRRNKRRNTEQR